MERSLYNIEIQLSFTIAEFLQTVQRMLRDRKISLALKLIVSFMFNGSRLHLCKCFNFNNEEKEIEKFVNSIKNKMVKSVSFYRPWDICNRITYNLEAV